MALIVIVALTALIIALATHKRMRYRLKAGRSPLRSFLISFILYCLPVGIAWTCLVLVATRLVFIPPLVAELVVIFGFLGLGFFLLKDEFTLLGRK